MNLPIFIWQMALFLHVPGQTLRKNTCIVSMWLELKAKGENSLNMTCTILGTMKVMYKVTVIIPALNEEKTIGNLVSAITGMGYQVVVVDDGSCDRTAEVAKKAGAKVVSHEQNRGYMEALRTGFRQSDGDIFVTMDADGQHNPADIPRLIQPILDDCADIVIGVREGSLSFSERLLTMLTRLKVNTQDASSGFKAIRRNMAQEMEIRGKCICGTFILEAYKLGARIVDAKVKVNERHFGKSRMKTQHLIQFFLVLKEFLT